MKYKNNKKINKKTSKNIFRSFFVYFFVFKSVDFKAFLAKTILFFKSV
ncbi:hypothetical protein HMPREF9505_02920 [Enterococcus faecalis TX0109]|nr:hypothetical protein HMPREF9505_02920 [Enterococcus faecalis TX0109]